MSLSNKQKLMVTACSVMILILASSFYLTGEAGHECGDKMPGYVWDYENYRCIPHLQYDCERSGGIYDAETGNCIMTESGVDTTVLESGDVITVTTRVPVTTIEPCGEGLFLNENLVCEWYTAPPIYQYTPEPSVTYTEVVTYTEEPWTDSPEVNEVPIYGISIVCSILMFALILRRRQA